MIRSKMISCFLFGGILLSGVSVYGQGRGLPPQVPANPGRGNFPGIPPNAGAGRPEAPGQSPVAAPGPNENAGGPAVDGPALAGVETAVGPASAVDQLARVPRLAARLEGMVTLPPETTLADLADGFRNLGQFVAAVQVSNNLEGVTFEGLRMHMLDGEGMSLGQAIQTETALSEEAAGEAASDATEQAEQLIEETSVE
jgi:hypothetical protein